MLRTILETKYHFFIGCALSLVAARELDRAQKVEKKLRDHEGLGEDGEETVFKPYQFKLEELDGFKYRAMDAWRPG